MALRFLVPTLFVLISWIPFPTYGQGQWINYTNGDYVKPIRGHADNIWAATNGGVVQLDKTTGVPTYYTRANSGLPANQPNSLHVTPNGDLWVLAGVLSRYDGSSWTYPTVPFPPSRVLTDNTGVLWIHDTFYVSPRHLAAYTGSGWNVLDATPSLPGQYVSAVVRDSQSNLWVAAYPRYYSHQYNDGGLSRYDGTTWTSYTFQGGSLTSNFISSLAVDLDGTLWISYSPAWSSSVGEGGGLSHFDGTSWAHFRMDNSAIPTEDIRALAIDPQGIKWLATDIGVVRFDGIDSQVFDTANSSLPSNDIVEIFVDDQGQVWVGTQDRGMATLVGGDWTTYDTSNSPFPFSGGNIQYSTEVIRADAQGGIWMALGITSGGLLWISESDWSFFNTSSVPLPTNHIFDIAFGLDDTVWLATPRGLVAFDGTNWQVYTAANSELRQNYAYCVAVDPVTGKVWVGNQLGLAAFDGTHWTHYDTVTNPDLPSNDIGDLAFDESGHLFVITRDSFGVVLRYDGTHFTELIRTVYGIPEHLMVDSDGALWATWPNWGAPDEGGIVKIDGSGATFFNTRNSGLPEDYVMDIAHDGRNLWIGTYSRGVARFDGTSSWTIFNIANSGLAQNAIGALGVGADGRVWIGGCSCGGGSPAGLSVYIPEPSVPVLLTDLRAERRADGVRLTWALESDRSSLEGVGVQRATALDGPYTFRTDGLLEPAPSMSYEDLDTGPDTDYWYRVVLVRSDGTRTVSSPVSVSRGGSGLRTALLAPIQPSVDLVQLRYTIGVGRVPVKLQIFDVAGRSVAKLDQGLLGPRCRRVGGGRRPSVRRAPGSRSG